jgi:tetratricopeptide (TPR) repeat protein
MKRFIIFCFCYFIHIGIDAQIHERDSLRQLLISTKEDTTKIMVLARLSLYEPSFEGGLSLASEGLALARKISYKKGEAECLNQMGNQYTVIRNYPIALHYYLQGLQIREVINDSAGMGISNDNIGYIYRELSDYERAKSYFMKALQIQSAGKDIYGQAITHADIGVLYEQLKNPDSALFYYQRSFEYFNKSPEKYQLAITLNGLGSIQHQLGHKELAKNYYRLAINNGLEYSDSLNLPQSYLGMAVLLKGTSPVDSSILYAKTALHFAQIIKAYDVIVDAGRLLSQLYQHNNAVASLMYLNMAMEASDSAFNKEKDLQIQRLSYAEQERQKEMAYNKIKAAEKYKHDLQYAAIALAIIVFAGLFLLLSRSIIVNEKWVKFLGVLGLLAVFEFINLLLHPYLGAITLHSPVLMLLALMAIAALLVPLHHKLEHWLIHKMVVKNKQLRLTAAKKILSELEKDPDTKDQH